MFTIKVIEIDSTETLFAATQTRTICEPTQNDPMAQRPATLLIDTDDGQISYNINREPQTSANPGRIYVMNRYGATVATYYL